jgi:glycosyltransferase involved in cell wall biosynthesis
MNKVRISYLLSHPIQYFSPLLRQLAMSDRIELMVYYCADPGKRKQLDKGFGQVVTWDIPLLDGYRSTFLSNLSGNSSPDNKFWGLINLGIVSSLLKDKSEIVIVHGWSYFTNFLAIIMARLLGKQVWLRGENPFNQEMRKPKIVRIVKKIILQYGLFKLVDRFLYIGTENRNFYEYYGVRDWQFIFAPYAVDNSHFTPQATQLKGNRSALRARYNVPIDTVVILFSGKYIQKKRPLDLLKAYARLKDTSVALVMVGEGEMRAEMENFIKQFGLKNVFLTGFINQSVIGHYYAIADIFVLPSGPGETWGLVVNEAMLFQLPVLVSSTAGCSTDLVRHGENGFIFEEGNVDELTNYLTILIANESMRKSAGESSGNLIAAFDYSVMIKNMEAAF